MDPNDSVNVPPDPTAAPPWPPSPWEAASPKPSYPAALPSGNFPQLLEDAKRLGWNWGGFLIPYLWLIGHGRLTLGFLLILSACVPFVGLAHLVFYPAAAIYLGLNGFELAWREQPYHSIGQLEDRERVWMLWGAALFVVFFVMLFIALIYLRFVAGEVNDFMEGL